MFRLGSWGWRGPVAAPTVYIIRNSERKSKKKIWTRQYFRYSSVLPLKNNTFCTDQMYVPGIEKNAFSREILNGQLLSAENSVRPCLAMFWLIPLIGAVLLLSPLGGVATQIIEVLRRCREFFLSFSFRISDYDNGWSLTLRLRLLNCDRSPVDN